MDKRKQIEKMEKPTLKKYWEANSSTERSKIVEDAFALIDKQAKQLTLTDVVASLPVLNRCECCEPQEEPIKICTNCNGYVE